MIAMDGGEFAGRAQRALYERIPAADVLAYREQLDLGRAWAKERLRHALPQMLRFFDELMHMDAAFAKVRWQQARQTADMGPLCFLLVARYVFAREAAARQGWRPPPVGGTGDKEMDESCLIHLIRPRRQRCRK